MMVGFCGLIVVVEGSRESSPTVQPGTPAVSAEDPTDVCLLEVQRAVMGADEVNEVDETGKVRAHTVRAIIPAVCRADNVAEAIKNHAMSSNCYKTLAEEARSNLSILLEVRVCKGQKDPETIPMVNVDLDLGNHQVGSVEVQSASAMAEQDRHPEEGLIIAEKEVKVIGNEHDMHFNIDKLVAEAKKEAKASNQDEPGKEKVVNLDFDVEHDTDIEVAVHGGSASVQDLQEPPTTQQQEREPTPLDGPKARKVVPSSNRFYALMNDYQYVRDHTNTFPREETK